MELFSVICTTCHSKLKVRERTAIGQILACPKCQAMVLIEPPAGWTDPGDAAVPLPPAAPTTAPLPAPITKPAADVAATASSTHFEDAAALLEQPVATPAPPLPGAAPSGEPLPLSPGVEWISPQTRLLRRWLLIGGLTTSAAIFLICALVYAVSGREEEMATLPAPASNGAPDIAPVPETEPVADPPDSVKAPSAPDPSIAAPPEAADVPEPVDSADPPVEPPQPRPQPQPADDTPPELAPDPASDDEPVPAAAPKPLNLFGELLEERPFAPLPGGEPDPEPQPPPAIAPTESLTSPTDDEPLPRPAPRKVDVARRLADPLEAIEIRQLPLADFVQLVTDLTLVPITLDPAALPAIKISPETKVSVTLQKTKVGDLLSEGLRPLGLAYITSPTEIVIVPAASTRLELREIKHDVSDLAQTAAAATVLAETLHACIDPTSWEDVGGRGTLEVSGTTIVMAQTPEAHFATVVLCEKLRLARKLPTRSAYPASVLTLRPRAVAADTLLATPVTMNFVPPTRIGRVADHLQRTTGLRLLVDWRTLAEASWTPEGEVKVGVAGESLSVFLDRLARRMEVSWRVIDERTVQLTTPAALAADADVEVYLLAADNSSELLARLEKELGSELFLPGGPCVLRYDTRGACLIARLPQPMQRKLIEILAKGS